MQFGMFFFALLCGMHGSMPRAAGWQDRPLAPAKPVAGELAGNDVHTYLLPIESTGFVEAIIEQLNADLSAELIGPDGSRIATFDGRWHGPEPVYFLAESAGTWRLSIRPTRLAASRVKYRIRLSPIRKADAPDVSRIAALKGSSEAKRFVDQTGVQNLRQAKETYEKILPLWRELKDAYAEAQTLHGLAFVCGFLEGPAKAIELYNQALAIRQSIGDREGEGETLSNLAATFSQLGKKQQALEYYNRALPVRRAVGNPSGEAMTLGNLGAIYLYFGDPHKAIEHYHQALPMWRVAANPVGEASAYIGLSTCHNMLGEKQKALDYLQQALTISSNARDRRGEAYARLQIGRISNELGDAAKAEEQCSRAAALFKEVPDRIGEGNALFTLGAIKTEQGDRQSAMDFNNRALAIWKSVGDRHGVASTLLNIARLASDAGEKTKAIEIYEQALADFQAAKYPRGEAITLNNLGMIFNGIGDGAKSLECFKRALPIWRDVGDRSGEAWALANLARAERDAGQLAEARGHIETALEITESLRIQLASQQLRTSFFATKQSYHEFYIDLLMRLHKQAPNAGHEIAALQASERARARGLLEMLAESLADVHQGIDANLLERERTLQRQINAKAEYQYRLLNEKASREQTETIKRDLNSLLDELQQVKIEIRKNSPRYAGLNYPQPLGLEEIRRLLDSDTILLEYALGEERNYLWAVTSTSIESFELPRRAEIEALARKAYDLQSGKEKSAAQTPEREIAEYRKTASALSRILLGPIAGRMGNKRLLITADGALQYLAFAALPGSETDLEPLIAAHEIVMLPSASSLAFLQHELAGRAPAPKSVAVIADPVFNKNDVRLKAQGRKGGPPAQTLSQAIEAEEVLRSAREVGAAGEVQDFQRLLFSRREAQEILTLASGKKAFKALDFAASRETAVSPELGQYRIIHFATHSLLNNLHPELSGIVLSLVNAEGRPQDGFLRLHDVYNLRLGADLVVLSACQTGLGKEIRGEGLQGLTRGFMYAGAPRVVASLWKVDDRATAELMRLFYRRMLTEGMRPAAALRAAQIDLMRQERWAAPRHWAGFVFQGEWK